jgi:Cys-tRNA(Pro)/Cys-tRNA(Cys) deacylase
VDTSTSTGRAGPVFPRLAPVAGRGTPATALLVKRGITHSVHTYEHDPRKPFGLEAAEVMGVSPDRVFKTLLAEVDGAERVTGYVAGGISPLGQRKRLPTALDSSAMAFPTVFCSGGRRGLEIELSAADLASLLSATVADIATR